MEKRISKSVLRNDAREKAVLGNDGDQIRWGPCFYLMCGCQRLGFVFFESQQQPPAHKHPTSRCMIHSTRVAAAEH